MNTVKKCVLVLFVVAFCGCGTVRKKSMENNALHTAFTVKMDQGETTRIQEQRFIRASGNFALELDRSIRGSKKANATRDAAKRAAKSGLSGSVLDLD